MSVPYHAWTHRPKALGGTDPIEAATTPTEWIKASSTTDLGTTFTMLDFSESGNTSNYDPSVPTFAINGNGDLEIGKDGMYDLYVQSRAWNTSPNQVEVLVLRGYRNTGANPIVLGVTSFSSPREVRLMQRYDDTTVLSSGNLIDFPEWYTPLVYFDGDISSDGVTDIIFEAYVEINGTGTATTDIAFDLFCRRIGPAAIAY